MKAHIVLAHPEPRSFNHRLAGVSRTTLAAAGWQVTFSDLYAMEFDPREAARHYPARQDPDRFDPQAEQRFAAAADVLPPEVRDEAARILACDLMIVHFPMWWFSMPAILKGWLDRVFAHGLLHRSARRFDTGFCAGKRVLACMTTGASAQTCAHDGYEGDVRLHLWPMLFPYRYVGFDVLEPEVLHGVAGGPAHDPAGTCLRDDLAERWRGQLDRIETRPRLRYNRDGDFDATGRLRPEAPSYSPFIRHEAEIG